MPAVPSRDAYRSHAPSSGAPARRAEAVTPSDTTDLTTYAKALYVGGAGDIRLLPVGADDAEIVTLKAHPIGYVAVQTRRVLATGTTATSIVALSD
jgi:hypothetical protein